MSVSWLRQTRWGDRRTKGGGLAKAAPTFLLVVAATATELLAMTTGDIVCYQVGEGSFFGRGVVVAGQTWKSNCEMSVESKLGFPESAVGPLIYTPPCSET
jgi:hypothetical protein